MNDENFRRAEAAALTQPEPSQLEQQMIDDFVQEFEELEHNEEVMDFLAEHPDLLLDYFVAEVRREADEARRIYDHLESLWIEYRFQTSVQEE